MMYKLAKFRADLKESLNSRLSITKRASIDFYASARNGKNLEEKLLYARAYRYVRKRLDQLEKLPL